MTWDEWEKEFPVEEVLIEPEHFWEKFSKRVEAEKFKDNEECNEDYSASIKVVKCNDLFYIVATD